MWYLGAVPEKVFFDVSPFVVEKPVIKQWIFDTRHTYNSKCLKMFSFSQEVDLGKTTLAILLF